MSQLSLETLLSTDMNIPLSPNDVEAALSSPPFVHLPSSLNLRDLGLLSNSPISPGLIYRSGAVHNVPPVELAKLNLGMVLGLRSKREVEANPNPKVDGVENVWVGWVEGKTPKAVEMDDFVKEGGVQGYKKIYLDVLEVHRWSFRAGLTWVLRKGRGEVQGGMLFHCTAGKDRTGVFAALLLSLAGASRSLIAFDYTLTRVGVEPQRDFLTQQLRLWNEKWTDDTPGVRNFTQVKGDFIVVFLDAMVECYEGVEGYVMDELHFTEEEVMEMKAVLRAESA